MSSEEKEVKPVEEPNEFDGLDIGDELPPEQEFSAVPGGQESMIDSGSAGTVYDWSNAPDRARAPPRIDLDGQELVLEKAEIVLPPLNREWVKSRSGKVEYKYCTFALHYGKDGQQEFLSGVRVFKRENDKYSHPTIMRDRKNQSSRLLGLYADFKGIDINEATLKTFMSFLNSKPKVRIKAEIVKNPATDEDISKNMIGEFLPE